LPDEKVHAEMPSRVPSPSDWLCVEKGRRLKCADRAKWPKKKRIYAGKKHFVNRTGNRVDVRRPCRKKLLRTGKE